MGAQFYPNCLQIKVQNGGSVTLPEGIPLPGSYDPYDPGILVQLWQITLQNPNYTAPGMSNIYLYNKYGLIYVSVRWPCASSVSVVSSNASDTAY